jgi:NAD+ kinase
MTAAFHRMILIGNPRLPDTRPIAEELVKSLADAGVEACFGFLYNEEIHKRVKAHEFDLLIALGGDGTMLRAGHLAGPANLPILGINLGHFGFLMELHLEQWQEYFPRLMAGDYWMEKRMMLTAEQWRGGERLGAWDVLNEVVVSRGQTVRPIKLATYVDNRFLTTYVADALIAATPTGSTAYALAAGGPILPPELRNILLVPVAPHLSLDRAIVLAEGATVSISVNTDHQAVFSVDGQVPVDFSNEDRIDVRAGEHSVHFIRFQDPGYFYRNLTPHMNHNPSTLNARRSGGQQ